MQRVGGDSATFEGQKVQHFQGTSRLVATRRFLLSQGHAGIHRKDIDHLQRRGGPAALVGAAQGLAVDCHHACEVETIGLGKGGHEAAECEFESLRLEQTEHPAERIVARDAMLQAKEEPQQPFLRLPKVRHIRARFRSAQHCRQRDEQHLQKIVPRIVCARIRQPPKNPPELAHPTHPGVVFRIPLVLQCNRRLKYAIPLPC